MIVNHKQKKHTSGNNLVTPTQLVRQCESTWKTKCNIDVCATNRSKRCNRFISKKRNFFKFEFKKSDIGWLNPPHEFTKKFLLRARFIHKKIGASFLILIPVNSLGNPYFKKYIMPLIRLKKSMFLGRIKFLNPRTLKPSKETSVNAYVTIFLDGKKKK